MDETFQVDSKSFKQTARNQLKTKTEEREHEKDKQTALQQINEVCDYFSTMRNQLEEVYSQTRFMEQPDGYIADQNHHNHLAAKSNNSDWWYYYEVPMVRKTRAWINSLIVPHKSDH